jgi:hypothetical protein
MECPYCGGEMEKGYLQGSHEVYWSKAKRIFGSCVIEGDIVIIEAPMGICDGDSYVCRKCGKVIIDIPAGT